jgi:hypothetical protein
VKENKLKSIPISQVFPRKFDALTRESLEKYQVLIYLTAISFGLFLGTTLTNVVDVLEIVIWPVLGALL